MRQRSDARGALRAPGRVGSEPTPEIRAGLRKSVRLCVRLTPNQGRGGGGRAPGAARVPLRRGGDGDERSGGGEARRRRLPRALLGLKRSRTLRERAGGSRVARPGPCAEKLSWRIEWKKTSEATRAAASEWNPGRKKGIETEPRRASLRRRSSLFASLRSAMKTWGGWGEGEGKDGEKERELWKTSLQQYASQRHASKRDLGSDHGVLCWHLGHYHFEELRLFRNQDPERKNIEADDQSHHRL